MKNYEYEVTLKFTGNWEAKNREEALEMIKDSICDETGIEPTNKEIKIIKVSNVKQ